MSNTAVAQFSPFPSVMDGYAAYVRAVEAIPSIEEAEEKSLVAAYRERNDTSAAHRLALGHLRLVVAIARGYAGYGLDQGDLVQEGNIGLLKAIKKFAPGHGARLATFATYSIRAEIHAFIMRNWRIVKIATTKAQRKLFFHMSRLFESGGDGEIRPAEAVAQNLGVSARDVREMRERVRNTGHLPLSAEDDEGESSGTELKLSVDEEKSDPETMLVAREAEDRTRKMLAGGLRSLNTRARQIIRARYLAEPQVTLQMLADKHKISVERVRQIEMQALNKLRRHAIESNAL